MQPRSLLIALLGVFLGLSGLVWGVAWSQEKRDWANILEPSYDMNVYIRDSGNSDGVGVQKERPQMFFIPPPRLFETVDPNELDEMVKGDYTPYALVQVAQEVHYRDKVLPKGYYQIKIGRWYEGSQTVRLHPDDQSRLAPGMSPSSQDSSPQSAARPAVNGPDPATDTDLRVMIFKKLGNVLLVVPITTQEVLHLPKKQRRQLERTPVAKVVEFNAQPVLQVNNGQTLFSAPLVPVVSGASLPPGFIPLQPPSQAPSPTPATP